MISKPSTAKTSCSPKTKTLLNKELAGLIKNVSILSAQYTADEQGSQHAPQPSKIRKQRDPSSNMRRCRRLAWSSTQRGHIQDALEVQLDREKRKRVVASVRESKDGVVKMEEGNQGTKASSAERAGKFFIGVEGAYKQAKLKADRSQ